MRETSTNFEFLTELACSDPRSFLAEREALIRKLVSASDFKETLVDLQMQVDGCRYPNLDDQIREHDEYREWLLNYLVAATKGRLDWQGMGVLLVRWWVHHILESDMTYKPYMRHAK